MRFIYICFMDKAKEKEEAFSQCRQYFTRIKTILLQRFKNDNANIYTNHSELRQHLYHMNEKLKLTTKEKVQINKMVRQNIQDFINEYVREKVTPVEKISKDPHTFVTVLNNVWTQYQVFIFTHFFVCEKFNEFFVSFYKMNSVKQYEYSCKNSKEKEEIVSISTMGVNQLKKLFDSIKLIQKFKSIFNQFLLMQREGKNVPRLQIKECVHSLESCYFDMDSHTYLEDGLPRIVKRQQKGDKMPQNRKSKDGSFFKEHLLRQTLQNLDKFYDNYVQTKLISMPAVDQIKKIIEIIDEEQARAQYYIHSVQNRKEYKKILNKRLLNNKQQIRIKKSDGFKKYIELYEEGKEDYAKEIVDFWKVYERIPEVSLQYIKEIFNSYLQLEAEKISEKIKKPPEFIQQLIRINGKCIKIIEFCKNNFDLENDRNTKIRGMMSNNITERGKKQGKFDIGAKNLSIFINIKFKGSYAKGGLEALGETYRQIVNLFKILQEKTRFIDQQQKLMANRLLQDVQFSKDLETGQILAMQKSLIEEIQKECGVSDVKQLAQNIKDIEKSIEINNKIKTKLSVQKIFPLNQLIIKNSNFWPQKSTFNIQNPPSLLLKSYNNISDYFIKSNTNIQFEFHSGVSIFKGQYENGKKQSFQLKNIYLLILLYIDEQKKILYGNLKKKIEAVGVNRQKGHIQLTKSVIELLNAGLIVSATKSIKPGTPNICKIVETDEFQINRTYDFVEEEKKKKDAKRPAGPIKALPILKNNILAISEELKKGFEQESKAFNDDEKRIEAQRKFKVECITVKTLKHAHHHHMNCTFDQLFKVTQQGKNKQYRANQKFLKEIVQQLINKKYCERVQGQRNIFRYIA